MLPDKVMEVTTSNKGGVNYTKKTEKKTRICWECSRKRGHSCKGTITIDFNMDNIQVSAAHCHESDPCAVDIAKEREGISTQSQRSAISGSCPAQILATTKTFSEATDPVTRAGRLDSLERSIHRQRVGHCPRLQHHFETSQFQKIGLLQVYRIQNRSYYMASDVTKPHKGY